MLRDEIGVLAQTVAGALDLDDDGVVKEPVQQGRGHDGITKNLAPLGKTAIGGEDHGAFFVAGVDELEEQIATAGSDRQVADLIDDQKREAAEEPALASTPTRSARVVKYTLRPALIASMPSATLK